MTRRITALLLSVLLLFSLTETAIAVEKDGSFVFVAVNANSTIVEPVRIHYRAGDTIAEALADSNIAFLGLDQGFVYEIAGVSANFSLYYDNGGYDLNAAASGITAICFHVSGSYSAQAISLINRMADYLDMTNHVQNYPAAADAYAAAMKGLRTADGSAAALLENLNQAISNFEALLNGTTYTVRAAATQNGTAVNDPTVTVTDVYGNTFTGIGSVDVVAGTYSFSVSDGGFNRTEGTVSVSADTQVSVELPYGEWFGDIKLLDSNKEPYAYTQNTNNHTAEYWVEDTAQALASIYLNAAMGQVPTERTTKLRTI